MKLKFLCIPAALLVTFSSLGQAPAVTHVDKYTEGTGRRITLTGTDFGTIQNDIAIYFGAQMGTVESVADRVIEVSVPPGATLEHITVTNKSTGLTGFSEQQFILNYGGEHPFAVADLVTPQLDFQGEDGLYDLCMCDLDGDGKTDIAASNDKNGQQLLSLFRNTSSGPGNINFVKTTLDIDASSLHVTCGDLNGDGLRDLVFSEGGSGQHLFILKNSSTPGTFTFAPHQSITLAGKLPKRIEINDLDMDGKPDLIVTDQNNVNKNVLIIRNTSSLATISFAAAVSVAIPATADRSSSDGLAVHDVNGDRLPEIIVTQFQTTNSNVFVFENESTQGTFKFTTLTTLPLSGAPVNLRVGDLNGDSKPDLAATMLLGFGISTFVNQSTDEEISFAAGVATATAERPWGIDLGDLDGDGKLDVVVASVTTKALTILNNTSTGGAITFSANQQVGTTFVTRHVKIGDLDGDGKPDIAFASVDDPSGPASKISTFRNKSCIVPTINPQGPLIVCSGNPKALEASVSAGATYQWKKNGVNIVGATSQAFTPVDVGTFNYIVDITSDACVKSSAPTSVQVVTSGAVPDPTMTEDSPTCIGATATLTAVSAGATGYDWTGPEGFTASQTAASSSVTRANFQLEFAGRYDVNVKVGTCIAAQGFVIVEAVTLPDFKIGFTGGDLICTGDSKLLTADPIDADFTYQWFKDAAPISGATGTTRSINATGNYFFRAQSVPFPACPQATSQDVNFSVVILPTVAFQSPAAFCEDISVTFTNQTVLQEDVGENFLWDFGDGSTSTDPSPTHTYANTGNFSVKLTAAYRDNACADDLTKPIAISALPTANIVAAGNIFAFCPGDNITLSVDNTFTSYLWNTDAVTPTIVVSEGGIYSVTLTNAIGCQITPEAEVTQLIPPVVEVTAEPLIINIGETTQLTATAGLASYSWSHPETLSDPAISSPIASPQETTTYVVTVTDADGCAGEGQIEVTVTFDDIVNLLEPGNFISPNGDTVNDTWEVGSITNFPQCGVKIFDEKGSKVYDAPTYLNDWDAVLNGKPLPNGVYFYFIQCEGESQSRTGSITVAR